MKSLKHSNLIRSIALFLVAAALIGTIGFAANGWQSITTPEDNSGESDNDNDNADNNKDNTEITPEDPIYIPKFTSYLTGNEITEAEYFARHICFAMNSEGPLYGLSSSEIAIELPTEGGSTRFISYMNSKNMPGKIGTVIPSRQYIDNIVKYFGGILVSSGKDDSVVYNGFDITNSRFDLSENTGYHYTEYTHYIYTNGDLITAGITNSGLGSPPVSKDNMPYKFTDFGEDAILGNDIALNIKLNFSKENNTELIYSKTSKKYILSKLGETKKDLINDKTIEFDNIFVLFADAITYETLESSEMVLDTVSGGFGKYIYGGTSVDISWSVDSSGNLSFKNAESDDLIINRGTSYIGFMKSSRTADLLIN